MNITKKQGFTLIEVLISMFILAVGLLGLAGLQATGLKNNLNAYYRSQASQFSYDMADRMRANLADAQLYGGSAYSAASTDGGFAAVADCTQVANACSTVQMAQNDLFEWNRDLTAILPTAEWGIAAVGTIYTITIRWDDNRDGAVGSADPSFLMSFEL